MFFLLISLILPPTVARQQMTEEQVEATKRIAANRIVVERVIGRMRDFALIRHKNEWPNKALMDHIMIIIGALVNLGSPLFF